MGILDVILGRDAQGHPSKINMALIALLLWRWYQSQSAGGAQPQPAPAPAPRVPRREMPEADAPAPIPQMPRGGGSDFDELRDSVQRMPRGGGGNGRGIEGGGPGGGLGGGGLGGGGLGDILGDILGGGSGAGRGRGAPGGPGGGIGDILGDILGGGAGRGGMPGARAAGQPSDPFGGNLGGLGGLLAGGAGGGVLADILSQFEQAGKGDAAKSWVARGDNIPVSPKDIESTFGSGIIDELASQFGLPRDELLTGLSQAMPEAVDALTPDGRLPTAEEVTRRI